LRCKETWELQKAFDEEIRRSSPFDLAAETRQSDVQLLACFGATGDAAAMEGPLMLSGLTLGLIPSWYSRELELSVTAYPKNGSTSQYTKTIPTRRSIGSL
jgi:hypothetical protein